MLLGVVFHASIGFMVGNVLGAFPAMEAEVTLWLATDRAAHTTYDAAVYVIHAFRMPVFFVLAGFFAHRVYQQRGARGFLLHRARRVLVPFVLALTTIVPLSYAIGYYAALVRVPPTGVHDLASFLAYSTIPTGGQLEILTLHLWFLEYLLVFYLLTVAVVAVARALPAAVKRAAASVAYHAIGSRLAPLWLAALTWPAAYQMPEWSIQIDVTLRTPLHLLAFYGVYYLAGWSLYARRDEILACWGARSTAYLGLGLLFVLPVLVQAIGPAWQRAEGASRNVLDGVGHAAHALFVALLTLGVIGLFVRRFPRPNGIVRYLADASYWVYLAHFPLVGLLAVLVAQWALPGPLKLLGIVAVSTGALLVVYQLVVRPTALGQLLGSGRSRQVAASNDLASVE